MYRSKEEAAKAPAGTEAVIADFSEKASLAAAPKGARTVPAAAPYRIDYLRGLAQDASEAWAVARPS